MCPLFNPLLTGFQCGVCGARYAPDAVKYTCPACGLIGVLDACYNFAPRSSPVVQQPHLTLPDREQVAASQDRTLWRYLPLLPLAADTPRPGLPVGGTPLVTASKLADAVG